MENANQAAQASQYIEQLVYFISSTAIMAFFLILITLQSIKFVKRIRYRFRLKRINLSEYSVFSTENGRPDILQHNKDKNKLVFL